MSLERLARELDETARQTGEMAASISYAVKHLGEAARGDEKTREEAILNIVIALQAQDRIEQRCRNLARAVRELIASDRSIDHPRFDEIWSKLTLDELAVPEMSGIAAHIDHGECDFFDVQTPSKSEPPRADPFGLQACDFSKDQGLSKT